MIDASAKQARARHAAVRRASAAGGRGTYAQNWNFFEIFSHRCARAPATHVTVAVAAAAAHARLLLAWSGRREESCYPPPRLAAKCEVASRMRVYAASQVPTVLYDRQVRQLPTVLYE